MTTLEERFWEKVAKGGPGECWPWTANCDRDGYGRMSVKGKQARAHRISYQINRGPIPNGLNVLHKCDNPRCVNPKHLFLGTNGDNMADKTRKGRAARVCGERNGGALLSEKDVLTIRSRHKKGETQISIAKDFDVSRRCIGRIVTYDRWAHIQ